MVPPAEQNEPGYHTSRSTSRTVGPGVTYDFTTIQEAIDAAVDGDTIIVAAGTYTDDIWDSSLIGPERYRIKKSVTLLGAQAGNDPAGSKNRGGETILVRTNGLPYSLYASDITIDGFMFGSSDPNTGGRLIISDEADNAIIRNCIIQNAPDSWAGHGVYIYPGAENALIEYNTFYKTAWEAIASLQVSGAVISHNHIDTCGIKGDIHAIQMMGHAGSNNVIAYNHISGMTNSNAIQYWGGPGATISHNVIDGGNTMFDGIWLDTDDSTVSHNQISDTIYAGISVRGGCTGATVTYNELSGCGTGIETQVGATGASVNYNNIEGNSFGVRNNDPDILLDATHNWWGHPGGPRRPAGNSGQISGPKAADQVSENVLYHPWLNGANSVSNIALDQAATASATYLSYLATRAVDGDYNTSWIADGYPPQWIEIDLGKGSSVVGLRLLPDQTRAGLTTHVVMFSDDGGVVGDYTLTGVTEAKQWVEAWFDAPFRGVRTVRVTTEVLTLPHLSWVAWYEIEVYGWQ
ncbi:MAG TPA: hypothetical protein DCP02_02490 [Actinobacteria bacterium]|nr:hypothetical protein [Actinomycetota bacterium]